MDLTWDAYGINVWSTVESCCSIIGVCLPTMRPLLTRAKRLTSWGSRSQKDSRQTGVSTTAVATDLGRPRSHKIQFWNPPPPIPPRGKAPYQSIQEGEDDSERGPDTYQMSNVARVVSWDPRRPPPTMSPNRGDRSLHPVLKSPRYQQEKLFAPPPSPECPRRT